MIGGRVQVQIGLAPSIAAERRGEGRRGRDGLSGARHSHVEIQRGCEGMARAEGVDVEMPNWPRRWRQSEGGGRCPSLDRLRAEWPLDEPGVWRLPDSCAIAGGDGLWAG